MNIFKFSEHGKHALLSMFLGAYAYIFSKIYFQGIPLTAIAFLYCAVVFCIFLCIAVFKRVTLPSRVDAAWLMVTGVVGLGLYTFLLERGIQSASYPANCIAFSTAPVLTSLLATLFRKRHTGLFEYATFGVSFLGIFLMFAWDGQLYLSLDMIWIAGAALTLAVYSVLWRTLSARCSPLQMSVHCFGFGAAALSPFLLEGIVYFQPFSTQQLWVSIVLGACPIAGAYYFWAKALSAAPAISDAAKYLFLAPVFFTLLECGATRTIPSAGLLIGGILVVTGIVLPMKLQR